MDIILLEKIDNLGNIGDRVKVKSVTAATTCCPRARPPWQRRPTSRSSSSAAPSWKPGLPRS